MAKTADALPSPENVSLAAHHSGRRLDGPQASGLAVYLGLLQTWNARTNLVGPRRWPDMLSELVADSWWLADLLSELPALLPGFFRGSGHAQEPLTLDFGAGAGIPGIPLRLFWGAGRYVLIEPRAKRAGFLRQCVAMLGLGATEVFEGRAQDIAPCADICLSRAFEPWPRFLKTASGFARPGSAEGSGPLPLAVVFATRETPEQAVPEGYRLALSRAYPSRGKTGYFWVFEQA